MYGDLTENDLDERTSTEKSLVNALKRSISKLYVMFVQSVILIFDSFNTFLQADEQLIYILHHPTMRLHRSLLSRFILSEVISESDDVLSIDLEDPNVLRISTVYLLEQ